MLTNTVTVAGRTVTIAKRPDDEHWHELKPSRSPSRPRRSPPRRTPAAALSAVAELPAPASPPTPLPWPLGRYGESVEVVPCNQHVQLAGYCIQFGVLSQPTEAGWREVVRPNALAMACRHRTPLWIQHKDEFVSDPDVRLSADSYGLRVESFGAARHNRALHASVLRLIDEGVLHGMSVHLLRDKCGYHEYPDTRIREFFHISYLPEISLAHGPRWPGTTIKAVDKWAFSRQRDFDPYTDRKLRSAIGVE